MCPIQKGKGITFIILSSFLFALMSAFVSLAGPLPFFQKVLFRNIVAVAVSGIALVIGKIPLRIPRGCGLPLCFRISCGTVGVFCNYYAIDHLMLASSNSLSKLSPFFAILFAAVFLKEKVSGPQVACITVALVGSGFLIFPNLGTLGISAGIALLGGIASGGSHVALRALRRNSEINGSVIVFFFSAVSTLTALIPSLKYWSPMTMHQIFVMLLAGSSCAAAQYALTAAYRYAPPKDISIYDCSQIVFSGLMGYVLFRQIPVPTSMVAYVLIILASVLLFAYYRHERR